jgi:hypothetical protein
MMKKIFTILSVSILGGYASSQVVINEVYTAGGNSGSVIKQDFVELYNRGMSPVTLTNAYLQYGGATAAMTAYALPTPITLSPGQYYLIQGAAGSNGTVNLYAPDATIIGLSMSATAGKIALTSDNMIVTSSSQSNVIDLVGWGSTASLYEAGTAPVHAATTSISRTNGVDTNNNTADFSTGALSPTNSLNQVTLEVNELSNSKVMLVKSVLISDAVVFGTKANIKLINMSGQVLKIASVDNGTSLDVSSLPKGVYMILAEANGEKMFQKIIKK